MKAVRCITVARVEGARADTAANSMHGDSFATDSHGPTGPLGAGTTATAHDFGGLCAAQAFDSAGRLFTVCGPLQGFTLLAIDPTTMTTLASLPLPTRPSTLQAILAGDLQLIFSDTSGGAYFYLDEQERVVLVDAHQDLRVIALQDPTGAPRLIDVARYPLAGSLVERDCFSFPDNLHPAGRCDAVTSVMPDWSGRYWFVSRDGVVGTVEPLSGTVRTIRLAGEEIGYSVDVVVMHRTVAHQGRRTICTVPVFGRGASAAENSLMTHGDAVIVQNTYGYQNPLSPAPGASVPGGVTRIDIDRADGTCHVAWTSPERVPSSAMKLSRGAGLLYGYSKVPDDFGRDLWYWTAIDVRTGATVYSVLAGTGPLANNNWGVISIGPDGAGYLGTINGLLRVRDGAIGS